MTEEAVAALFMQIQLEYPFMSSVADSAIITNHSLPDEPIIFCNDEFTQLTGYTKDEILGRNCRFLQGKHTDPKHVQSIRDAIRTGTRLEIDLLNYRKDGTPFINGFCMLPLHENGKTDGKIGFFLAIQKNVTVLGEGCECVSGVRLTCG
jgi:PAS domain S-box-containing protein